MSFQIMSVSRFVAVGAALAIAGTANAQFMTGFEPPTYTGSPAGTPITGQDMWTLPGVAGSLNGNVYTYAGNALNLPLNPTGGEQFLGGRAAAGNMFVRAERLGIDFSGSDVVRMCYDTVANFDGAPPAVNNLGSFSLQPVPNPAAPTIRTFILLHSWPVPATPTTWQAGYLAYTAAGAQFTGSGMFGGPAWQNLALNSWYRLCTTVDFTSNRITEISITDAAGMTTTAQPTDWYLGGGMASTLPRPTGVRFFVGGNEKNVQGFDNLAIGAVTPPCAVDLNGDGMVTIADFLEFLNLFSAGDARAEFDGMPGITVGDFLAFLNAFSKGC